MINVVKSALSYVGVWVIGMFIFYLLYGETILTGGFYLKSALIAIFINTVLWTN